MNRSRWPGQGQEARAGDACRTGRLDDPARLASLRVSGLMAVTGDVMFGRMTALAARLLRAPVSLVSLVDDREQHFVSEVGVSMPWSARAGTGLAHSLCQYVVRGKGPLIVSDARADALVCLSLAVPELGVVAYAGMPLNDGADQIFGSMCAIDHEPRNWSSYELAVLGELAWAGSAEIQLRLLVALSGGAADTSEKTNRLTAQRDEILSRLASTAG
jgi:GAF domain-containing protein